MGGRTAGAKSSLRWGDWGIGGLGVRKAFLDPMPRKICELRAANLLRPGAWLQAGYHLLHFLELLLKIAFGLLVVGLQISEF